MITVVKGNLKTQIMERCLDQYRTNGWAVVDTAAPKPKTEEVAIVVDKMQAEQAAHERGSNAITEPVTQAEAIVKSETKPRARKTINTGLIKPKEKAAK